MSHLPLINESTSSIAWRLNAIKQKRELIKYGVSLILNHYFIAFQTEATEKSMKNIITKVHNDDDDDDD